ncbi:LytTR family DNA-binding domain-containing protein [Streptococcus orisasini]|uniref:LytTR family DNA-binding domain-containing protein n=1 Tax=Streptococcus orisasini TaxID=1080071 RepID=UPI00187C55DF|nr:LytTR family DNA-binding domain-containing protein [Streptococcus orisasini]
MKTMKLRIEQDASFKELEVSLKYSDKNRLVERILTFLESVDKQISCYEDGVEYLVNLSDIYYIESVDKKTFVYLANAVYQTDLRLYQLLQDLQNDGFVQISKSCLLNINVLESIRPLFNSRMEATLLNGEKVIVNRSYLNDVKEALKGSRT